MAVTVGMSKCMGAACVRGAVMKELVLGRHQFVHTSVCTNFYGTRLSVRPGDTKAVLMRQDVKVRSMSATGENGSYKEPTDYDYDLVAIGAGSGGVRAARFAAQFGAKVAICEMPFERISSDEAGGVWATTGVGPVAEQIEWGRVHNYLWNLLPAATFVDKYVS